MIKYDKKSMSLREEKKEEEVHIRKKKTQTVALAYSKVCCVS